MKVRIAVVVDKVGNVFAAAPGGLSDWACDAMEQAEVEGNIEGVVARYWVEVEMPDPEPPKVVKGTVEKA